MLGIRRSGVTNAAGKLQKLDLIHYHRGHIKILDYQGLVNEACECYQILNKELSRLFDN
ncbi:helix-turn-helix domain-containing protein [Aphanothece sacrum]|nr:helix-turn-helix domain-containing protein [Aphanothece sacrum]